MFSFLYLPERKHFPKKEKLNKKKKGFSNSSKTAQFSYSSF
nr:MAG: hypothetical protein [Bacteriophage sp.]